MMVGVAPSVVEGPTHIVLATERSVIAASRRFVISTIGWEQSAHDAGEARSALLSPAETHGVPPCRREGRWPSRRSTLRA